MGFEVEQKFRVPAHTDVASKLADMGAVAGASIPQEDTYLSHPCRDFAQTNEAFRVRRVGERNAITYKGPRLPVPTKTRPEFEVDFSPGSDNLEVLLGVFLGLGFRQVAVVRKVRIPYHMHVDGRDVEVALDQVDALGTFVEVEALASDEADLAEAQRAVQTLSRRLSLDTPEPRSYLRMLLESRERS